MSETWIPRASSDIAEVEFDSTNGEMSVTFQSGGTYRYFSVPAEVYSQWQRAPSAGQFFHRQIKDRYGYEQL